MGWPILKQAAHFKMGQISNQAVTYIAISCYFGVVKWKSGKRGIKNGQEPLVYTLDAGELV